MSIYIFYHIYCNEKTESILKDQINKIIFSGLYDTVEIIYLFLAGEQEYINKYKKILDMSGKKFKIAKEGVNDTTYERFTLSSIKKYIKREDKFLYIHTKGVGNSSDQIYYWRTYME